MISFCIPAFTHVHYTIEAVRSILVQDADFELVVLEDFDLIDANSAQTHAIDEARSLFDSDRRIRWSRNGVHHPIQVNWNLAVAMATMPYVKLLGADDRVLGDSVSKLREMIRAEPSADIHGHLAIVIDGNGSELRRHRPYYAGDGPLRVAGVQGLRLKLRQVARFKEPVCNLFKRLSWEKVGGYQEKFRFCFDIEFAQRLAFNGSGCLWNVYAVELRRHAASDGATLPAALALNELQALVESWLAEIGAEASDADRKYAKACVMYRVVELGLVRFRWNMSELVAFLYQHRALLSPELGVLAEVISTMKRRAIAKDVQKTIRLRH